MRLCAEDTAAGAESDAPPRFSHSPQTEPLHTLRYTALSVPTANTSRRSPSLEVTAGEYAHSPPKLSQLLLQDVPFQVLRYMARSQPLINTSTEFSVVETAAGAPKLIPPKDNHSLQQLPSQNLCQTALSAATLNKSILLPQAAAATPCLHTPPKFSHSPQVLPSQHLRCNVLSWEIINKSMLF